MQAARLRLIISVLLFAGWISWLAYLAATTTRPIILSRPQFLFSTLDVVAQIGEKDHRPVDEVKIEEVHWPPQAESGLKGKTITVTNLNQCEGWDGPGDYILPLEKNGDHFEVVKVPESPGYRNHNSYRIYRRTPETMRQLQAIPKPDYSVPVE